MHDYDCTHRTTKKYLPSTLEKSTKREQGVYNRAKILDRSRKHSAANNIPYGSLHLQPPTYIVRMIEPLPKVSLKVNITVRSEQSRLKVLQLVRNTLHKLVRKHIRH
ncbi:hypothetical protein MPER_11356 [Moniliophthora perniciosa FA553]|nr:hypothetical protein MPER_11356 [Moniliophthora perniciosa FA553]